MTHSADRRSHSSWRSTGWVSLRYPLPAIVAAGATSPPKISGSSCDKSMVEKNREDTCGTTNSSSAHENLNPFFPLHGDVMLACVRELLILDGSIDKKTLEVVYKPIGLPKNGGAKKEESLEDTDANSQSLGDGGSSFQFLRHTMMPEGSRRSMHKTKMPLLLAEDIANVILQSAVQRDGPSSTCTSRECPSSEPSTSTGNTTTTSDITTKPPRKVSDANFADDMISPGNVNTPLGLPPAMFALVASGHHVSLLNKDNNNKSQPIFGDQLPNLVHLSISAENHLRAAARTLVETMTLSFEDRPLREFLGYRSSTKSLHVPKRHQLVEGIASFLFDVSHATFAFEAELAGMDRAAAMSGSLDHKVCGLLFDDRSLRGIGGFDSSSLLRHALSIGRSRAKNQSWKAFATSAHGRNMLRHHWSGNATALVGQKRRRNRPRSRSSGMLDDEQGGGGKRSRSSSVSSYASTTTTDESHDRQANHLAPPAAEAAVGVTITPPFGTIPDVVSITIEREIGCSWGVSLANEGDMCVVQRVSHYVPNGLKIGDMIVSAKTPEGMCVRLASLPSDYCVQYNMGSVVPEDNTDQKQSFYRRMVNLFKERNTSTLILEVRRVGGGIVALG